MIPEKKGDIVKDTPQLDAPLTLREARERLDENGDLVVVVAVSLEDIGTHGGENIEAFNDFIIDKYIVKDFAFTLSDIRYRVVGHIPGEIGGHYVSGSVLIEVRAEIEAWGAEDEESVEPSDPLLKLFRRLIEKAGADSTPTLATAKSEIRRLSLEVGSIYGVHHSVLSEEIDRLIEANHDGTALHHFIK